MEYRGCRSRGDVAKLHRLNRLCSGEGLFPSLHSLFLGFWPISTTASSLFLSHALRSITINDRRQSEHGTFEEPTKFLHLQHAYLTTEILVNRSPRIQQFVYFTGSGHVDISFLNPVYNLKHLTVFSLSQGPVCGFKGVWLNRLSEMETLRQLWLPVTVEHDKDISSLVLGPLPFPLLKLISARGRLSFLTMLFQTTFSSLQKVTIETHGPVLKGMNGFLHTLAANAGKHLAECSLWCLDSDRPASRYLPISAIIRPLTRLRHLKSIFLVSLPCTLTDEDIFVFTESWPNLEVFHIILSKGLLGTQPVTLPGYRALFSFASRCPRLLNLWIPLNLEDSPRLAAFPDTQHNLAVLHVPAQVHIPLEHHQQIASVISRLFPHLDTDTIHLVEDKEADWTKVLKLMEKLQTASQQAEIPLDK